MYFSGTVDYFIRINLEYMSMLELKVMDKILGYKEKKLLFYAKILGHSMI